MTVFEGHVQPPRSVPREFGGGAQVERVWLRAASLRPGCPLVCVSSADGGVGRSTLVAALGAVLALAFRSPVVAVDMTGRAWGGLVHRVRRRHPGSVWDAFCDLARLTGRRDVERWVQRGPTGLHALVGEAEMTTRRRPPVHSESEMVVQALRAWYPIALLDLPPAELRGIWVTLTRATAPVLVARATTESLQHTMRLLAQLRAVGLRQVADVCVLVVMCTSPAVPREVRGRQRQAAGAVGELVVVPYDDGLARPEPLDPRSLRRATRRALIDVAAAVLARCPADPQLAAELVDPPDRWAGRSSQGQEAR